MSMSWVEWPNVIGTQLLIGEILSRKHYFSQLHSNQEINGEDMNRSCLKLLPDAVEFDARQSEIMSKTGAI